MRLLFSTKKNLRIVDLFNKIDVDGSGKVSRDEIRASVEVSEYILSENQLSGDLQINRLLVYERVYLPLYKVADTHFHIQGDEMFLILTLTLFGSII